MDYKNLKRVIELIREHDLSEFEMENEGFRLSVKRGGNSDAIPVMPNYPMQMPMVAPMQDPGAVGAAAAGNVPEAAAESEEVHITSPMVGIFYTAPSPDAKIYVTVGQEVQPDTVVCIIEAMKVMNELKADVSGIVREVLVDNANPVEFGQPLFRIDPL